ncbi:MAG TPA: di-heme oxidoredictase family protein [Thermoanaerobaculia bacterium]|nr:di-heme oxidoredictase family protein [Thermoanaerobaculia bacterium]
MSRRLPIALLVLCLAIPLFAQTDPGVRGGGAAAGQALASVLANNPVTILNFFNDGKARFQEIDSVSGTVSGENGVGLGPRYNSRSCASCHAQPAVGGTSPFTNPQVGDATADGARNSVPSFITVNGPVREARFPFFFNTQNPNGGVEDLYTIAGRVDAGTCTSLAQPDFNFAIQNNDIIFRIPTPTFGSGLMENIDDSTLLANFTAQQNNNQGVTGSFNRNGNDGTISRFGWKAQNKSLEIFVGEAYNVEQGVTNELFQTERPLPGEDRASGLPSSCRVNATPEDHTNFNTTSIATLSDTVQFAMFMRLLAPPTPSTTTPGGSTSINNGHNLFNAIGCNVCHTQSLTTTRSAITPSLGQATANLFSDIEIHHMGTALTDNVSQGDAGGDQFRTAPLWGLGQRIFFMHDGRTSNLINAILAHNSSGSEANNSSFLFFNNLTSGQQQDVLNFLRSL